jgi:hypothetical protein
MKTRNGLFALSAVAALALAACGGGGSSAVQPSASAAKAKATAPPSAAARTSVGSATLTLSLPLALSGKKGVAMRARAASKRSPNFVDPVPNPNPTAGVYPSNLLDIYVDGTLIPNIDGQAGPNHSVLVGGASNGQQTLSVPLYSTSLNDIVVIEWDYTDTYALAIDEDELGQFYAGNPVAASVTLDENVTGLGIVDVPGYSYPMAPLNGNYWYLGCNVNSSAQFGIFGADALGDFVPLATYDGTSTPTVSFSNYSGSSPVTPGTFGGSSYTITWDQYCDSSSQINATVSNPANTVYSNVTDANNYQNYATAYVGQYTYGPYQGIWNLFYEYENASVINAVNQASTSSVSDFVYVGGGG